jgi:GNAT superfamily N-acetyltransferase
MIFNHYRDEIVTPEKAELIWNNLSARSSRMKRFHETIDVRLFRPTDVSSLAVLVAAIVESSLRRVYGERYAAQILTRLSAAGILERAVERDVYVAEYQGRIVATGSLSGDRVDSVFVTPSLQRRGIGRRLMTVLEEEARRAGTTRLRLDASLEAELFYRRLGWQGRRRVRVGAGLAVRMSKPLSVERARIDQAG